MFRKVLSQRSLFLKSNRPFSTTHKAHKRKLAFVAVTFVGLGALYLGSKYAMCALDRMVVANIVERRERNLRLYADSTMRTHHKILNVATDIQSFMRSPLNKIQCSCGLVCPGDQDLVDYVCPWHGKLIPKFHSAFVSIVNLHGRTDEIFWNGIYSNIKCNDYMEQNLSNAYLCYLYSDNIIHKTTDESIVAFYENLKSDAILPGITLVNIQPEQVHILNKENKLTITDGEFHFEIELGESMRTKIKDMMPIIYHIKREDSLEKN